jgi:DNA-binding NarL/FixJ family response regulator
MIRILIADDHRIFREGLRKLLEGEHGLEVVGEAANGAEAVELSRTVRPDLVLFDWKMQETPGLVALRELCRAARDARVLLLTAAIDPPDVAAALTVGACGVVLKESAAALLIEQIHRVMAGHEESASNVRQPYRHAFELTARERDVAREVASGYGNKDIAKKLMMSEKTVKHHLTRIFEKLGVSTRLELALFVVRKGWQPPATTPSRLAPVPVPARPARVVR